MAHSSEDADFGFADVDAVSRFHLTEACHRRAVDASGVRAAEITQPESRLAVFRPHFEQAMFTRDAGIRHENIGIVGTSYERGFVDVQRADLAAQPTGLVI